MHRGQSHGVLLKFHLIAQFLSVLLDPLLLALLHLKIQFYPLSGRRKIVQVQYIVLMDHCQVL